jgi:hypothetical protein
MARGLLAVFSRAVLSAFDSGLPIGLCLKTEIGFMHCRQYARAFASRSRTVHRSGRNRNQGRETKFFQPAEFAGKKLMEAGKNKKIGHIWFNLV